MTATESLWLATSEATSFPRLDREREVDGAIVGGGITGVTVALLLKREGVRVAVLERRMVRVSPDDTGIRQARAMTDRLDARTLARLLWTGELDAGRGRSFGQGETQS